MSQCPSFGVADKHGTQLNDHTSAAYMQTVAFHRYKKASQSWWFITSGNDTTKSTLLTFIDPIQTQHAHGIVYY